MTIENKDGAPELHASYSSDINSSSSIDAVTENFTNMAVLNNTDTTTLSVCANCGKESNSDDMNTCNKCKSVKYCNAACKKKHRSKHKKACERRVAELYDEKLFKEIEPEECPICMLPVIYDQLTQFKSCCGKSICMGCIHAMNRSEGHDVCPFCRVAAPTSFEENIKRVKKLMDKGNGNAFNQLAGHYANGEHGLQQDYQKAHYLMLKAGEHGYATGYYNLGVLYYNGIGVEVDKKKGKYFYELAAMGGNIRARHHLGNKEYEVGNIQRAKKHFVIAARAGIERSLYQVKVGYTNGVITKDEYADTLRAFHKRQKEMKSDDRDRAEAFYGASRS